jgi:hypothetical protein
MYEIIKRTLATPEQIVRRLKALTVAFPNRDDFFELSLDYIIPLKLTDAELEAAVKSIIGYHRGQLFIADIVDECLRQKKRAVQAEENRIRRLQVEKWRMEWIAKQQTEQNPSQRRKKGVNFE